MATYTVRRHLVHTLVLGVLVIALAVPLITYIIAKIQLESHFRRQALGNSAIAARQSVFTFLGAPPDVAAHDAETVRTWVGAEYVEFIDADSARSVAISGQRHLNPQSVIAPSGNSPVVVADTSVAWHIAVPVLASAPRVSPFSEESRNRRPLGILYLRYSKDPVTTLVRTVTEISAFSSACVFLLVIAWGTKRLRALTFPLDSLAAVMLQADHGNVRASVDGAAEIATIAKVFNGLMERIERHREHLELTVELRTTELARALDAAQQAERYKTALLSASTHELKKPLHLIEAAVRHALNELEFIPGTAGIRDDQRTVLRASGELMSRIEKMLRSARVQGESHQLLIKKVPCKEFVELVAERLRPLLAAHDNTLKVDVTGDPYMTVDDEALFDVLSELLFNACKYTRSGTISIRLHVEESINVDVSDTGCGIAAQDQTRIWDVFYQCTTASAVQPANYPGQGLGLTMVKWLVTQMGGEICLQSALGQGSTFRVFVPCLHTTELALT